MASIQCNPMYQYCGEEEHINGNFFQRMSPHDAHKWFGVLSTSNLFATMWLANICYNDQAVWNSNRRRRNQNSAIWAWNIMFFWHGIVFGVATNTFFWSLLKKRDKFFD